MALTPDEVVNKTFQPTKFREGYDQDEVDDFLDEVVGELRRLLAENQDLRTKLAECESGTAGASGTASTSGASGASGTAGASGTVTTLQKPTPAPAAPGKEAAAPEKETAVAEKETAAAMSQAPEAATGVLALAQRLHDEHVRSGQEQRDRLVAEAQEHATHLVTEAEERKAETLGSLEQERSLLERKIDELRSFERDYRTRLKSYLETQLRDLEAKAAVVPGAAEGSAGRG